MRAFSAEYLDRTREGMWRESRTALEPLSLSTRERILDVGCGTGEFSQVAREESEAEIVGCDADRRLLERAREHVPTVVGDALTLPFYEDTFDLVVCQALLINLPEPAAGVAEFARVSSDLVAAIEPDNAAVTVDSTVDAEERLERRVRRAYLEGVDTDAALGDDAVAAFEAAGVTDIESTRYDYVRETAPPYGERALAVARRKATGAGLADDRETLLDELDTQTYDAIRTAWREMGRDVVEQMRDGRYRREETVPFYVLVGRVPD